MDRTLRGKRSEGSPTSQNDELDALLRSIARAPPRSPPRDPPTGANWGSGGRYVIERRLGRGGMGTVYVASDTLLGRLVALKVLDTDDEPGDDTSYHARLLREARVAASLEHERVARVYDVGEHDGSPFVAMEYVRGVTLRAWMSESPREPGEIVAIVTQIAEGLSVLHASGVIHRDLKPENVMLAWQGGTKLLDFGLARQVTRAREPGQPPVDWDNSGIDAASFTACLGTPGYMAPEHCRGQPVDARADVFALGVIVYELVTSQRPFRGSTLPAVMRATLEETPVLDGGAWERFPAPLRGIAERMLQRDPAARFADGAEVLHALRELQAPSSSVPAAGAARSLGPASTSTRWRRWWAPAVACALLAGTVVVAAPRVVRERARRRALAHALALPPPVGMMLVDVGTMTVGRTPDEVERQCADLGPKCDREKLDSQLPARSVTVAPFYMDVNEVTNADMAEVLNAFRGSLHIVDDEDRHFPRYVRFNRGLGHDGELLVDLDPLLGGVRVNPESAYPQERYAARAGREKWPATQVSWFGARLFCAQKGKRLPTDIEWEAAARGAANRSFPWGEAPVQCGGVVVPPDGLLPMAPGCSAAAGYASGAPWPVGEAPQDVTPQGIRDLGGNVAEWVDTPFDEGGGGAAAVGSLDTPRVLRGGSYFRSFMARTSSRQKILPNTAAPNVGFRCVASVDGESAN